MSGLKRFVSQRRNQRGTDPPSNDTDRASAPLMRRFTTRREPPVTPPPGAPSNRSKQLDIAMAMATPPVNPPVNSASTDSSTTPGTPHRSISGTLPKLFLLCRFSVPCRVDLVKLLSPANQPQILAKADAERTTLATTLDNARDLAVVDCAVENYIPYAISCSHLADQLSANGFNLPNAIAWHSGLVDATSPNSTFTAGFSLEVSMVLMLAAVNKIRHIVENDADFAMQSEDTLALQNKSLQAAAGIFSYVRDIAAPAALSHYSGPPPPEIVPDTASMFCSLSLAMAQALRVRRAALGGMSEPLLAKLSAAAAELTESAKMMYDKIVDRLIPICPNVRICIDELHLLCRGWLFQYVGLQMSTDTNAGEKVGALRAAHEYMEKASKSPIFGNVAKLDLEKLEREHEDAARANSIVHRHAIPTPDKILLPPSRVLATPTPYEPPLITKLSQNAG